MKAAVIQRHGAADDVTVAERPVPAPAAGRVRVRVRAASLNPLDAKIRAGVVPPFTRVTFPLVLGFDFAGEIDAVEPGVSAWAPGERVYGRSDATTGGTHAEFAVVSGGVIDRMPAALSFTEAASLPLTAMTAVQAFEKIRLQPGDRLLVNGAAGGVGSAAVQIGRARGASVSGVCSPAAAPLVARLGARVLDYTAGELARVPERFDVVFDTVFGEPQAALIQVLDRRGRYITTGFSAALARRMITARLFSRQRFSFLVSRADGRLMREVSALVTAGQLTPVIDATFPLARITDAYGRLERGHLQGKIVIAID